MMMAASQRKLAVAEAHHEKTVQQARGNLTALFGKEADLFGSAIGRYSAASKHAVHSLAVTANSTKDAAEKVHSKSSSAASSWGGPDVEERAKIGARVQATQRETRRLERRHTRAVAEAEGQAVSLLEDAAQRLSRKLGDLSASVDEAKAKVEAAAANAEAAAAGQASAKVAARGAPVSFAQLERQLQDAKSLSDGALAAAQKQLGADVARASAALDGGVASIEAAMVRAQEEEIKGVRSPEIDLQPLAKKAAHSHVRGGSAHKAAANHGL